MDDFMSKLLLLEKHLVAECIIEDINKNDLESFIFKERVENIRRKLQETYPQTKLKRMMKSVHYANSFSDENLKQSAFILDEVEQLLSINKFLNHDLSVKFFNNTITSANFSVTPASLVETMIESLLISKGRK